MGTVLTIQLGRGVPGKAAWDLERLLDVLVDAEPRQGGQGNQEHEPERDEHRDPAATAELGSPGRQRRHQRDRDGRTDQQRRVQVLLPLVATSTSSVQEARDPLPLPPSLRVSRGVSTGLDSPLQQGP